MANQGGARGQAYRNSAAYPRRIVTALQAQSSGAERALQITVTNIRNAQGKPIHAGTVARSKDQLFVLDTTNPGGSGVSAKDLFRSGE